MGRYLSCLLAGAIGCPLALGASAFVPLPPMTSAPRFSLSRDEKKLSPHHKKQEHQSVLFYKNENRWQQLNVPFRSPSATAATIVSKRRSEIKKELAKAAITNFDQGKPLGYAEDLMKELETMRPWERGVARRQPTRIYFHARAPTSGVGRGVLAAHLRHSHFSSAKFWI